MKLATDRSDPRFREALRKVGASYIPPSMNNPPLLVGGGSELFDIVVHMPGLGPFEQEMKRVLKFRIIASKKATGRPKDRAILPALEDTLRTLRSRHKRDG